MSAPDYTPTIYSDAGYWGEIKLPTTKPLETDTHVPLVIRFASLSAYWAVLTSSNFVITLADGTLVPSYAVTFDATGLKMQLWIDWPTVSVSSATYLYIQIGGSITRSNSSAAVTNAGAVIFHPLESIAGDIAGVYTPSGTGMSAASAKIDNGMDFSATSERIDFGKVSELLLPSAGYTILHWRKDPDTATRYVYGVAAYDGSTVLYNVGTTLYARPGNQHWSSYTAHAPVGQFNHFAMRYEAVGPSLDLLINGSSISPTSGAAGTLASVGVFPIGGTSSSSNPYNGILDNFVVYDSVKSQNWCTRAHNNENDPDAFFVISDLQQWSSGSKRLVNGGLVDNSLIGQRLVG